ncbi:Signal transduction histidine kinase [Monaibacterium marinum]|uniref:histidine kinase n=1 Tax=Pontivivens marinum TaxID=1690039 RepID=A0A2C9CUA1_9RHOB|nr:ATP-binding protein [Monaibacterium marinum]SOH94837.1 Signal transduction histidine kinase [Monaibacterium marinum]
MTSVPDDRVSRRRYNREQVAREAAEKLLEEKSRELFLANKKLTEHSANLENAVVQRTAELRKALEQSEAASLARSRFIATMSHEIRTPLGGMLGMIDLLTMDETDPEKLELLTYAKTAGLGLNRIVNDVLDFSKMDAGVFVFEEESIDIRALAESVRMLAGMNPAAANRTISLEIDRSVPKLFSGDATRIRQVLSNLVSNACRYSEEGVIYLRARMTPHPKGGLLRVEVQDFGVGIPEDKRSDLFKDFSQVANPLTAAAQGTGLGLAICKRILEGCGGIIDVDSTAGVGSTFWFELPVEVISELEEDPEEIHPVDEPKITLDGKKILIAEDNIINQRLLLTYLDRMNIEAVLAKNGRIAVEEFAPGKFDLILMDIAMPEMDGLEATQCIREKWPKSDIPPIIALTAHVMDAIAEDAASVGIDAVLSKPIPFEELKQALETAINSHHQGSATVPPTIPAEVAPAEDDKPELINLMAPGAVAELTEYLSLDDLVEIVADFINDSKQRVGEIAQLRQSNDRGAIAKQAHSLRGSSLTLGFTEIANGANELETQASSIEDARISQIVEEISGQIQKIEAAI